MQAAPLWVPPLCGLTAAKQPLVGWPLATGGASARRRPSCWRRACSRLPSCGLLPLRLATPCRGPSRSRLALAASLAVGGRPYMGAGRGWPALHGGLVVAGRPSSSLPSLRKCSKTAEIVYPCIPNPDGEDEGGQASSSLAISTL
ncbi:hypothetical protein B296_00044137 [Ensete ventricosum]|uniref:Uncharacterized protein n=1 Tax=Ensete ventricosum TaxID=4639 RepID=A0A426X174_ENSVE|nr:hypothetical protein B296_00044137 [Ensete ventricosum]